MQQPVERGPALVVGQAEEAAVRGEGQVQGPVADLPLGHREVGEDAETGDVQQSHGLVLAPRPQRQDLRAGVKGQRGGGGQQVHDGPERFGLRGETGVHRVHVHHPGLGSAGQVSSVRRRRHRRGSDTAVIRESVQAARAPSGPFNLRRKKLNSDTSTFLQNTFSLDSMSVRLTEGAIEALFKGTEVSNTVLQLLNIKQIANDPPRIRLILSDGVHTSASFLMATQLNHLFEENLLEPYCVCLLKKVVVNTLKDGRRVVIVMEMEIIKSADEVGDKIGNPVLYNSESKTSSPEKADSSTPPSTSAAGHGNSFSWRNGKTTSPQKPLSNTPPSTSAAEPRKFSFKSISKTPSPQKPFSSTPPSTSAARPGPSYSKNNTPSPSKGRGRGFTGKSPMKAANASPGSATKIIPISALNPYQSKWTVRARVTNKSKVRTWSNSKGEGKLFSFEVVDESGEIRITAFNNEVDKFFSLVEQGKVYHISKGTLKAANKQFNTLKHEYEMTLHGHSSIVPCDDSEGVPDVHCDFVPISELENREKDTILDVIGVCKSAEDVSRITTKTSREVSKRALTLMDMSGKVVTVTLWGEEAEKFDGSGQPVVAIKGARLSDFGGRSLSALFSSTILVNPDIPEAFRLRAWFDQEGHAVDSQSLTEMWSASSGAKMNWKTLSDVKSEHMGHGEKADYFSCIATVVYIRKENCLYQACPSTDCNKKVIDQHNGRYRCEKCNRDYPNFQYRLLLSANLADFRDNQWVTCFQETAEVLLGHSAESLGQLRDTDEEAFDEVFQKASFTTHIFKNRVKLETYNDECRVKVTVLEILPVDHREYSRRLLGNIDKLSASA